MGQCLCIQILVLHKNDCRDYRTDLEPTFSEVFLHLIYYITQKHITAWMNTLCFDHIHIKNISRSADIHGVDYSRVDNTDNIGNLWHLRDKRSDTLLRSGLVVRSTFCCRRTYADKNDQKKKNMLLNWALNDSILWNSIRKPVVMQDEHEKVWRKISALLLWSWSISLFIKPQVKHLFPVNSSVEHFLGVALGNIQGFADSTTKSLSVP